MKMSSSPSSTPKTSNTLSWCRRSGTIRKQHRVGICRIFKASLQARTQNRSFTDSRGEEYRLSPVTEVWPRILRGELWTQRTKEAMLRRWRYTGTGREGGVMSDGYCPCRIIITYTLVIHAGGGVCSWLFLQVKKWFVNYTHTRRERETIAHLQQQ